MGGRVPCREVLSRYAGGHIPCHVGRFYPDMPVVIFRPSIVVGDSSTGRLNLFNVLYTPLRFVCRGDLPVIPCRRRTVLDIVPVDYVAGAICYIIFQAQKAAGKIFHITAGDRHYRCPCDRSCQPP